MPIWWFPTPKWTFPIATALDHLVLLDRLAVKPSWPLLKPGALVIADTRLCPELPAGDYRVHHLPLSRTALQLGSERVTNIVALGALVALSGICDRNRIEQAVRAAGAARLSRSQYGCAQGGLFDCTAQAEAGEDAVLQAGA